MEVKFVVAEDFVNYKKPSLFIGLSKCSFKCDKEYGSNICQNSSLVKQPNIDICIPNLVECYVNNPITKAIVIGGLEPFDTWQDLLYIIKEFRLRTKDDIIIYTGYYKEEIQKYMEDLHHYNNIIIKYGRFIPNQKPHLDPLLGVNLASDNQYAEKIY